MTTSTGNCIFGYIYWRNPWWKTSYFVQYSAFYFKCMLYYLPFWNNHNSNQHRSKNENSRGKNSLILKNDEQSFEKNAWFFAHFCSLFPKIWVSAPCMHPHLIISRDAMALITGCYGIDNWKTNWIFAFYHFLTL